MEKIKIGTIVNAVGLKGEVKVYNFSENPDRYEILDEVYLLIDKKYIPFKIENVRYKENMVILKLAGIDDRNKSESIKKIDVYMDEKDLEELPEGVFYIKDMIGMDVVSDEGKHLGKLKDVLTNTPQRVYVVERGCDSGKSQKKKSDILIPGVDEFILDINDETNTITVKVIEGLYED